MSLPLFGRSIPVLLALAPLVGACSPTQVVEPAVAVERDQGIAVTGEGEVTSAPDVARVRLGVRVRAENVPEGTEQAAARMASVVSTLKSQGVAEKDIQTQQYSVHYEEPREPRPRPEPPRSTAPGEPEKAEAAMERGQYVVTNLVEVTVRDLGRLGALLQAATASGANEVWGVEFDLDDPKPAAEEARTKAVTDAHAKAKALAELAGVELGKPVLIREHGGGPMPRHQRGYAMEAKVSDVPVQPGELTISRQVEIVYRIR